MLIREMSRQGSFLFRWRGYLPLALSPLLVVAVFQSGYFGAYLGDTAETAWMAFSAMVSFLGLAVRVITIGYTPAGTSGRNAREQRADELNTTGIYSVVRNPLYLGNYLMLLGVSLASMAWWLPVIITLSFLLYYERIIFAEEEFLAATFHEEYTAWSARTPLILPRLRQWEKPNLSFSLRNVLRREYSGFYALVVCFTLVELGTDMLGEGMTFAEWLDQDFYWIWIFAIGTLIYLTLRTLKRHTSLLSVSGR
ncbi:MAG: lipid A phosphate methyltransferase [Alphaproteobacteria bacterium]|nr:lipid A phosphate methyltransferase [Alphaproteobacteria bacterium]